MYNFVPLEPRTEEGSYNWSEVNMATAFGSEDFIIDASKKGLVETHTRKIDRLFEVKIAFDVLSTEGKDSKQWLVVSGSKENRSNAKVSCSFLNFANRRNG